MDLRIGFVFFCFDLKGDRKKGALSLLSEELGNILFPLCPDTWTKLLNTKDYGNQMARSSRVEGESSQCQGGVLFLFTRGYFEVFGFSVFRLCYKHGTLVCLFWSWFVLGGNTGKQLLDGCLEGPTSQSLQITGQVISAIPTSLHSTFWDSMSSIWMEVFWLLLLLLHLALSQHFCVYKMLNNID